MLSINTNLSSLIVQNSMGQATSKLNQAIERMSTGFKINHASDNAANYSISTNMTTKMSAYQVAEDNTAMGLDMVTTLSENLDLVSEHARRIRDLCEQASNGTYGNQSLQAIQSEIDARLAEITRLKSSAEFNGIKLLESEASELPMHVTGSFIEEVDQLTEEEAIAQGYTIIKTADELQAMQDNLSGKYILMNDIDLDGYNWTPVGESYPNCFRGELNGNGFVIKNLTIDKPTEDYVGLFGSAIMANLINLGLENVNITAKNRVGGLLAETGSSTITNCYVTGKISGNDAVGGVLGFADGDTVSSSYSNVLVLGNSYVGVLGGDALYTAINSYYNSELSSFQGNGNGNNAVIGVTTAELNALIKPSTVTGENTQTNTVREISLQIGIHSDTNSQITFDLATTLSPLEITITDSESARASLSVLDNYLAQISEHQTNLGAVTNRLESALDEIAIQYDNLASSRSTLRDADMAELSSTYIQQQILQQASATLLATANQSPSIALQLI